MFILFQSFGVLISINLSDRKITRKLKEKLKCNCFLHLVHFNNKDDAE